MKKETFKKHPLLKNVIVSSFGRVFRMTDHVYRMKNPRELSRRIRKDGYVDVHIKQDGIGATINVHRLVMETFKPNKNSRSLEVGHLDADRSNNNIGNLRWVTPKQNGAQTVKHGHSRRGARHPATKIGIHSVYAIRYLKNSGMSHKEIGAAFRINPITIKRILKKETFPAKFWKREQI